MLDFIMCASANLFRIVLIDRFVSIFFGGKVERKSLSTIDFESAKADMGYKAGKDEKIRKIFVCACFYVINTALFWEFHTMWINIACNLIGISAIVRLYTKSVKTNLFVTCAIYFVFCGCDIVATIPFVHYRDGVAHSQVCAVLAFFLMFICEIIAEKMITVHNNTEEVHNFSLILVPVCSITVISLLFYTDSCGDIGITIVGLGLLMVNFLMLYLYNLLARSISEKYEMEMLRKQVQIYANQLDVILQGEEKIKSLQHDMKHHLNELMLLANQCDVPSIQEYIEKMGTFIQNPKELIASGNMQIDSLLNYMLQKARAELKTVHAKVMLPEAVRHSFDINVLLGNLLENAIEAAGQTEQKYLGVRIMLKRGVMRIKIENSFEASNILKEERQGRGTVFLTTKPFKEQHGIGLKNVEKIVEKYNGTMKASQQNDIFCVKLILYMSKIENTT